MNMAKLGTVSAGAIRPPKRFKPTNHGLYRVTTYTLCANRMNPSRKGWRHSFAFYIPAISRRSTPSTPPPMTSDRSEARTRRSRALRIRPKVAVLVPLQLILITESNRHVTKNPQPPYGAWASGVKKRDINYSTYPPKNVTFVTPSCATAFQLAGTVESRPHGVTFGGHMVASDSLPSGHRPTYCKAADGISATAVAVADMTAEGLPVVPEWSRREADGGLERPLKVQTAMKVARHAPVQGVCHA